MDQLIQATIFLTGSIASSAKRRYLSYSEADFEVFRPAWATRCTVGGEIWHGGGDRSLSVLDLVFGRPFVKRFALCYRTVVCLSVLSVTLVYCGQTVEWIKMKLGMAVGLGPGHIVLDGDPAPSQRGTAPQFSAHVCCV